MQKNDFKHTFLIIFSFLIFSITFIYNVEDALAVTPIEAEIMVSALEANKSINGCLDAKNIVDTLENSVEKNGFINRINAVAIDLGLLNEPVKYDPTISMAMVDYGSCNGGLGWSTEWKGNTAFSILPPSTATINVSTSGNSIKLAGTSIYRGLAVPIKYNLDKDYYIRWKSIASMTPTSSARNSFSLGGKIFFGVTGELNDVKLRPYVKIGNMNSNSVANDVQIVSSGMVYNYIAKISVKASGNDTISLKIFEDGKIEPSHWQIHATDNISTDISYLGLTGIGGSSYTYEIMMESFSPNNSNLILANNKLEIAQASKLQTDIDTARAFINSLDGTIAKQSLLASLNSIASITYYVSTTGNDANDGMSISSPFKTIQKAANILKAGDICLIRGGVYREMITLSSSGTATDNITFKNYEDEAVTINGVDILSNWVQHSGNIYKTNKKILAVTDNQIFVNGNMVKEARFPNDSGTLFEPVMGIADVGTNATNIVDSILTQPEVDYWKGAKVYCLGGIVPWTFQTSTITEYDPINHKITFDGFSLTNFAYDPKAGSKYYIYGTLKALDIENEWFYDDKTNDLYFYAPDGVDPNILTIEAKVRKTAIDLSDKSYINISGINIFASGITTNDNTTNCLIDEISAKYVRSGSSGGISIYGRDNVLKNSIVDTSSGPLVAVNGIGNKVLNCLLQNSDYNPTASGAALVAKGDSLVISNNTVRETGRFGILIGCKNSEIMYNDIYNFGRLTGDLGGIYGGNSDGGNTRIHHNKIHDTNADKGHGIYLDSHSMNYIIDHNVVWNCLNSLHLNSPSNYNLAYNNTLAGKNFGLYHSGSSYYTDDMYGCRFFNNIFTKTVSGTGGAVLGDNIYDDTNALFIDSENYNFKLQGSSPAMDTGAKLGSINAIFNGSKPDCGAYEYEEQEWQAGYSLGILNEIKQTEIDIPFLNLLSNGGFENGDFSGWTKTEASNATIVSGNAWINNNDVVKHGIKGARLGVGLDGIERTISGLYPNTEYALSCWLRCDIGEAVELGVKDYGDKTQFKRYSENYWKQFVVRFVTGTNATSATIYIKKTTSGTGYAYLDAIGLTVSDQNLMQSGFESGDLSGWVVNGIFPSISSDFSHNGRYSVVLDKDNSIITKDLYSRNYKKGMIWLYDDINNKNANVMIQMYDGKNVRGICINSSISTNYYITLIGAIYTTTAVPRKTGWHKLIWDCTTGDKIELFIDGIKIGEATGLNWFNQITVESISKGSNGYIFVDDFELSSIDYIEGTFENGLGGFSTLQTPSISSAQKHSGNKSLSIKDDLSIYSKTYDTKRIGTVSMWFYDNIADISAKCIARVDDGNLCVGIGVDTSVSNTEYVYRIGDNIVATNLSRLNGWHNFVWVYSFNNVKIYIDGNEVAYYNGLNYYNKIQFGDFWQDGLSGAFYFDEITVSPVTYARDIKLLNIAKNITNDISKVNSIFGEIINEDYVDKKVSVIVAKYSLNNNLISVNTYQTYIKSSKSNYIETDFILPSNINGCKLKVFVWENEVNPLLEVHNVDCN